jgi:predicted PurR-regulated permease PerM
MNESQGIQPFATLLIGVLTIGLAIVLFPFWKAIFWAVVFAMMFWPLQLSWKARLGERSTMSALLIIFLILFCVLIPALVIGGMIADGAALLITNAKVWLDSNTIQLGSTFEAIQKRFPGVFSALKSFGIDLETLTNWLRGAAVNVGQFVTANLVSIGQGAASFAFQLMLMLYLTFAFLCKGDRIYAGVFHVLPLGDDQKRVFSKIFTSMALATLKGTVAVGVVQGILGSLIFWLMGIESAVFWGAIMALLSVIPPFGAGFIWGPAALILALNGDWGKGLVLFTYGTVIISMSDNIIRPIMVGRASSVPDYLVLLTTLGGLISFGITGLVLGPVVAALFISAWQMRAGIFSATVQKD